MASTRSLLAVVVSSHSRTFLANHSGIRRPVGWSILVSITWVISWASCAWVESCSELRGFELPITRHTPFWIVSLKVVSVINYGLTVVPCDTAEFSLAAQFGTAGFL